MTNQSEKLKCFACDRTMKGDPQQADTRNGQIVYVGPCCLKKIIATGDAGYQPPKGGPRLYPMPVERSTMSHIFDSVMALCACGTRFWPRDKHDTKCYGCQTEERNSAMEAQRQP
jgi:hypothetical protein